MSTLSDSEKHKIVWLKKSSTVLFELQFEKSFRLMVNSRSEKNITDPFNSYSVNLITVFIRAQQNENAVTIEAIHKRVKCTSTVYTPRWFYNRNVR